VPHLCYTLFNPIVNWYIVDSNLRRNKESCFSKGKGLPTQQISVFISYQFFYGKMGANSLRFGGKLMVRKKDGLIVKQSVKTKLLCPHCGHDNFKVTESKAAWLVGQKFKCEKCGGTFKRANVVKMHEKTKEYHIKQTGIEHHSKKHH
jgi:predicted RNA-binding Zn-ribbon protein involved in translation (DUF1610 family)